ncbi:MAG: sulfatase-like hydrolase/transferase [Lachnospiraceae bacterium]|nr:sulfatase-like hydrolase/transferase [Lachnospiraceae bacterium]
MLKIVRIVSFVLLAIFSVTVVTTGIVTKGYEKNLDIYLTSNNVMDYSNDKNFIIIVMDMARGEYEKAALDNNQEFRESFKDFTYYDNYASGYFFTDFALPLIISGEWFEGQERYDDYNKHAFYKSDFIGQMKKNGYKLGLYTDNANTNTEDSLIYQNAVNTVPKLAHPVIFSKVWLKMVAYKYFPFFLKKYVQVYPNEFNQYFEYDNNYRKWNFAESNIFFYRECKNLKYNVDRDPQFKLIHLKGVHVPFDMIDPETDEWVPTLSYDDSIKSMDIMMEAYLNRLKEDGVYDNSVIIFMSDHGVSFDGMHEMWERQDSFLMIKGFDEHHDILQINSAPISQADLKDSYYELLNGKGGGEIFKWNEGDERERRIIYTDYDYVMKECIIKGDSKDTNYIFTGNEYGEAIIGKFHR